MKNGRGHSNIQVLGPVTAAWLLVYGTMKGGITLATTIICDYVVYENT